MAIIRIDYDEVNQDSYKSVILKTKKREFVFDSGNFVKDWANANKKLIMDFSDSEFAFSYSSSVNDFISDGDKFDSGYLHMVEGKPVLLYLDRSDPDYLSSQEEIYEGFEFFVESGKQPSWEELQEYVKN